MRKGIINVKKGLAVLLSACMVFGMTPITAGAEESGNSNNTQAEGTVSGNEGQTGDSASGSESSDVYELTLKDGAYYDEQHVKYTFSGDTATVVGWDESEINADTYSADDVEAGNGWEITIPAKVSYDGKEYGVTTVGECAFDGCKQLTKVEFPKDSVLTKIDVWAFQNCSIKEITLPESLTTISDEVFSGNSLKAISIPKNVSSIGEGICRNNTQLSEIKVDAENENFNVGLGDVNCIVDSRGELIQGCSTSVIPNNVTRVKNFAFAGVDIRNIDFSKLGKKSIEAANYSFIRSIFPEEWVVPECFSNISFYGNSSLKKVTFPDNNMILIPMTDTHGFFCNCPNLQAVVFPSEISARAIIYEAEYDAFNKCNAENLTVYVGDFSDDSVLYQSLKAHAYADYTGDSPVITTKDNDKHYILRKAYRVQLAEEYVGYTLAKAEGCTTLTPIPGDSVRFVINAEENYKKNVIVYAVDDNGKRTELTKAADGAYTLNNVNENNYKISLENTGACGHSGTGTYTASVNESGNPVIIRMCDDCGYQERGNVTATWRHGVKSADSVAFSCDNTNIKGTFTVTEDVIDGKDIYQYQFTPVDGTDTTSGSVMVIEKAEDNVSETANGITYSTVASENNIAEPLGNCTEDIYYDSTDRVLYINGPETYVLSGKTTADRIVVNNTKSTTLVLNDLDIQMTALPAIDLQGTAEVKIILADKTENILKSGGDYAALQKNDLTANTPKLTIYGPGSLNAEATGNGAGIGAQSKKTASNMAFQNAIVTAKSDNGFGIGNGSNTNMDDSKFSTKDYIINGGKVEAESKKCWGISGGITVDGGAKVKDYFESSYYPKNYESSTDVKQGFICRYCLFGKAYSKMSGDMTVDFIFKGDGLVIPENTTLTLGYNGEIYNQRKEVTNNGKLVLKGGTQGLRSVTNNGTIYNYSKYGNSLKGNDIVTGSGTLHEDIDHDGLCDICDAHEDIGNVSVSYDENVTVMQEDTLTLTADVTPKEEADGKEITYQWYELNANGYYTKIDGATTPQYVQENCSLELGEHTYRLEAICDGIKRYIPFTVMVKKSLSALIGEAEDIVNKADNNYSEKTLKALDEALTEAKNINDSSTQEERWDAYNALERALKDMKEVHTIVKISSNPANSGILDGGGKYDVDDEIKLKAQAVDGFVFVGWYDKEQITDADQPVSKETTYNYGKVTEQTPSEISLYAVYKSNENRQLSMTLGNGTVEYSYQNGTQTGTWRNDFINNDFARGTYFTVTAQPNDGYTFLYWINSDGRVLSDSPTYSFYLGDNMKLEARYKRMESDDLESGNHYVIFKDMNGKILWSGDVSMNQGETYGTVKAPEYNIFTGYIFKQWKDASGNVINVDDNGYIRITDDITIYAEYEAVSGLKLTVNGVQSDKTYSYGSLVTVTTEESRENKHFSGWYIGDKLVSDKREYSFYITEDTLLDAKYEGSEVITQKPIVTLTAGNRVSASNNEQTVPLNLTWSVPEGYEFMEAGLIRSNDGVERDRDTLIARIDGTNVRRYVSNLQTAEGVYIYTLRLASDKTTNNVYAVGYITFKNTATGEVTTEYTDIVTSESLTD